MVSSQGSRSPDVAGFPGESSTRRQAMCVDSLPVYARQLVAGGSAGAFAKTVVAPLKQIKMCFQFTSEVSHYQSFKKVCGSMEVFQGFIGNGACVLWIVPYAALQFMTYEQYRSWMWDNFSALRTGHVVDLLAGSASGGTAVLCTYPLDSARASLSYPVCTRNIHMPPEYILVTRALAGLYKHEGLRGLYRSVGPRLIRVLPFAGLKFYVYEALKSHVPEEHQKSIVINLSCGAFAGFFGQIFVQPLVVVRHKIMVGELQTSVRAGTMHKNALVVLATIVGWQQLFSGISTNLISVNYFITR